MSEKIYLPPNSEYFEVEVQKNQLSQKVSFTEFDTIEEELAVDGSRAGVEIENLEDQNFPFDADKISIQPQTVHLPYLLDRLKDGTVFAPELQRGAGVWDNKMQSRLIESLMLRIPLQLFYVAADQDERWSIIDGLQRITAIERYINKQDYLLTGLEFLKDLTDLRFNELPPKYKNRIRNTQLQFAVVGNDTPPAVQRNIFKRLNTGGMPLTPQEIRHALYHGPSANILKELVDSMQFKEATTNSINDTRMAARELVLRFIAFLIRGPESYPVNNDMDSFLSETMELLNIMPDFSKENIEKASNNNPAIPSCKQKYGNFQSITLAFQKSMNRAYLLFGNFAFRKSLPQHTNRSPINKALFDTIGIILAEISDEGFSKLQENIDNLYTNLAELYYNDEEFNKYVSRESSRRLSILKRFEILSNVFLKIGENND